MKMSYFFGTEIDTAATQDFMNFLNEASKMNAQLIDVYLRSQGGDLEAYMAIKEAMETSEIPIHLKGVGMMASAGFMLMYFTDNIVKSLSHSAFGLVHLITTHHDDRDMRKPHSFTQVTKNHIDTMNNEILALYKKHKVITASQIKQIEKGEDVTLTYSEMYKIMSKCPFGTFLEEGETIIFQE